MTQQYHGAIRGWRMWLLTESSSLRSLVVNHHWKTGVSESFQKEENSYYHSIFGFFSFKNIDLLIEQEGWNMKRWREGMSIDYGGEILVPAVGSILGWGKVHVHDLGMRSQYALPEYLVMPPINDFDILSRYVVAADKYNIQPISLEDAKSLKTGLVPYRRDDDGRPDG